MSDTRIVSLTLCDYDSYDSYRGTFFYEIPADANFLELAEQAAHDYCRSYHDEAFATDCVFTWDRFVELDQTFLDSWNIKKCDEMENIEVDYYSMALDERDFED